MVRLIPVPRYRDRWNRAWHPGAMSPGPVSLWMIVLSGTGGVLGAGPVTVQPAWLWKDGCLHVSYGDVRMDVLAQGCIGSALIAAVSETARIWSPVVPVQLGHHGEVRPGWTLTVSDGNFRLDFGPVSYP